MNIVEQQLPGEYELTEVEYEQRGLPDAWIHDDDQWSLVVESKVAAPLNLGQLQRHYRTAKRRGFEDVTVLAIDVSSPKKKMPDYVVFRTWRDIYSWLSQQSGGSDWALRALRYIEVAERKWPLEGYLREGTLTEFSGIHFDENNPYNYGEAKRLIRLMMGDLRKHSDLKEFIDPKAAGRGAITGKSRVSVWDYLRLKGLNSDLSHTNHPHLSLSIRQERVDAFLLMPNSVERQFHKAIIEQDEEQFFDVMESVSKQMGRVLRSSKGSYPFIAVSQRRWPSRAAKAITDGEMRFDLRTAFDGKKKQAVKIQPQWLSAVYYLLTNKKSNMDLAVGLSFPYETCKKVRQPAILDSIAASWVACKPLLDIMPRK